MGPNMSTGRNGGYRAHLVNRAGRFREAVKITLVNGAVCGTAIECGASPSIARNDLHLIRGGVAKRPFPFPRSRIARRFGGGFTRHELCPLAGGVAVNRRVPGAAPWPRA